MKHWTNKFLEMADLVASWSKDPSTKVGSVIVDNSNRIISTGYNGLPRGIKDSSERINTREVKLSMTIHAEDNAILFSKCDLTGMTLYVTMPPCSNCACKIIQSGIKKVVCYKNQNSKWEESIALSRELFLESGVILLEVDR